MSAAERPGRPFSAQLDSATWIAAFALTVLAILRLKDFDVLPRLVLAGIVFACAVRSLAGTKQLLDPVYVTVQIWFSTLAFYLADVIRPIRQWDSGAPILYLLVFLFFIPAGAVLSKLRGGSNVRSTEKLTQEVLWHEVKRRTKLLDWAATAGFIAAIAFTVEMLVYNAVDIGDMSGTRAVFTTKAATPLTYITLLTRPGGVVALLIAVVFQEKLSRPRFLYYAASGLSLTTLSLFAAGRFVVLQVLMTLVFGWSVRKAMRIRVLPSLTTAAGIGVVLLGLVSYMFYVSDARTSGQYVNQSYLYTFVSQGLEVHPDLLDGFDKLPLFAKNSITSAYAYGALPIHHFCVFWNIHDYPLTLGAFQFQIIFRNLHRIISFIPSSDTALGDAYQEFLDNGEPGFTWQTAVRDSIIDFGRFPTLLVALAFGAIAHRALADLNASGSLGSLFRLFALWMLGFHSAFYSLGGEATVMVLFAAPWLLKARRKRARAPYTQGLRWSGVPARPL